VEYILSGTYQCMIVYTGDSLLLDTMTWILGIVWEVLTLCLAVWIAVKHFHELRQHSTGGVIRDCFTVLMKTHMRYFAR
jgi:preprotein translocase subunit SecG